MMIGQVKKFGNFFRSALDDKNSESRSMVLKYAEDKLKAEAIESYFNQN